MKVLLKEIATIKAGHPFRGTIKEDTEGNGFVVQVKNLNVDCKIDWSDLMQTTVLGRGVPGWLKNGSVLFFSRGPKLTATAVKDPPENVVCSPHFFVIELQNKDVLPEFLAWQLNQDQVQRYLNKSAAGSAQVSVKRGSLENVPLTIPSVKDQKTIVKIVDCTLKEKHVFTKLVKNRERQLKAIAQTILK